MSRNNRSTYFLALPALLLCTGIANAALPVSPLTTTPATVALSYQKPAPSVTPTPVLVKATASTYFTVDTSTLPVWLTLDALNGTAVSGGVTVNFSPNAIADSLGAGTYSASVHLITTGNQDAVVPVSLVVKSAASTLSIKDGSTLNPTTLTINWNQGSAYPTYPLTLFSSDQPISVAMSTDTLVPSTPANWVLFNRAGAVAYSFGTPIVISFVQQVFDTAQVGDALTANVNFTANGTTTVIALTINIKPPAATISTVYPSQTPVLATGTVNFVLSGTGFVTSGPSKTAVSAKTTAGSKTLLSSGVTVVNSRTILVALDAATYLAGATSVTLYAVNPPSVSASTTTVTVTLSPIIYTVTDTASFVENGPGGTQSVAPYELISIFGDNFGPTAGSPVTVSADSFGRYPAVLADGNGTPHNITVTFYKSSDNSTIADAYLLFAANNQINAIVPSGVAGAGNVDIKVTWNNLVSTSFTAKVVTANPGVFTVASSGQGQGAIMHSDYSVNSSTHAAAKGSTVLIYMSGLGAPNSTALNTNSTTAATFPASCVSLTNYMGTVNAGGLVPGSSPTVPSPLWTSIDGAALLSTNLATNRFAPCFTATLPVTVTIGGKSATVTYAGFVADSVAGLYQVNAVVPTTVTTSSTAPVVVTIGTGVNALSSQAGVTMAVQ